MSCVLGAGQEVNQENAAAFIYKGTYHSPQNFTLFILKAKLPT